MSKKRRFEDISLFGGSKNNDELMFKTKPKSSFTRSTKFAMNMVSLDSEKTIPFGTFIYRANPYPGDIDLIEYVIICCDKKHAIKEFVAGIKKIIKRIKNSKGYFLGDVKLGLDLPFFDIKIGEYQNGRLVGYNPDFIIEKLLKLYKKKYLNKEDLKEMISLCKYNITPQEHENLGLLIRDKYILRWTMSELLRGYKNLPGNRKITLAEAMSHKTLAKIDMWATVDGKYIEVTNVFILLYKDESGEEHHINFFYQHVPTELRKDIYKYYYSENFYKPFKMAKRMWSLSRLENDTETAKKITPLLRSFVGILSQVNSEIETLIAMMEHIKDPPMKTILKQIEAFKPKLVNILNKEVDIEKINEAVDAVISTKTKTKQKIEILEAMKDYFKEIINKNTVKFLEKVGLYPPPKYLLP